MKKFWSGEETRRNRASRRRTLIWAEAVGSNPTSPTTHVPTLEFGMWLKRRGNRISTIERKLRYLKELSGSPSEMVTQILNKEWVDLSKSKALGQSVTIRSDILLWSF